MLRNLKKNIKSATNQTKETINTNDFGTFYNTQPADWRLLINRPRPVWWFIHTCHMRNLPNGIYMDAMDILTF